MAILRAFRRNESGEQQAHQGPDTEAKHFSLIGLSHLAFRSEGAVISSSMNSASKIPTGVPGLDNVLMGGLIPSGFYLIQGDPGSSKTTIAKQYAIGRVQTKKKKQKNTKTETTDKQEKAAASHQRRQNGIDIC